MSRLFNGTSEYIRADGAVSFSQQRAYSVSLWANYLSTSTGTLVMAYAEAQNIGPNPFLLFESSNVTANRLLIAIRNDAGGTSQLQTQTTAPVFDGLWHNFIYTQDNAGVWASYVDGIADVSGTYATGTTTLDQLGIGINPHDTSKFFPGLLAHIAKWQRKLSSAEAIALGLGVSPLLFNPTHYWPLLGNIPEPDFGFGGKVYGTLTGSKINGSSPQRVQILVPKALIARILHTRSIKPLGLSITPTTGINATSTVSGTVGVLKRITPSNISATSTVNGSVRALRKIVPANINATSAVSGSIHRGTLVSPATIHATSTLTASLYAANLIIGNIFAISHVSEFINIITATVPAGYYGIYDTEDGIIP